MTKEELEHDHIKKIAENYVNESWGSFADLSGVDLVMAGIGVAKIISKEKENRIEELEKSCEETQELLDKQIEATYKLDKENAELEEQISTKDILIKELQEQKVYWKESSFDWRHKFFKLDKVKRLIKKDKQLAQAKKIIKRFSAIRKTPYLEGEEELFAEAEQFLIEVKK